MFSLKRALPRPENGEAVMTLTGHLDELRSRLIHSLIAVVVCAIISYFFIEDITRVLTAPAGQLYFMKPADAFFIYIKLLVAGGVVMSSPFLFYEFWAFLVPAFSPHGKKVLTLLTISSLSLFAFGGSLAFFFVVPKGLRFFLSFGESMATPMISMSSYLNFVIMLVLPFGLVFNLPLILIFLAKMGIVNSEQMGRQRKYVIFGSFVASAVLTATTDVFTQCLLALPMIILYEISRLIIKYAFKK